MNLKTEQQTLLRLNNRENRRKQNQNQSLRDFWDCSKGSPNGAVRIPEAEKEEGWGWGKVLDLAKPANPQFQRPSASQAA